MKEIKALFFDIDATIYTHRTHDFPQSTKKALLLLKEQGYKIAVATSRCRYETKNLPSFFHTFDFDAMIFDGGALVLEHDQIIAKHPIDTRQVRKLVTLSKQQEYAMRYSTFDGDYFHQKSEWFIEDEFFRLYLNMPLVKPYEDEEVFNMLAYAKTDEQEKNLRQQLDRCAIIKHGSGTFEITAYDIDKSIGVKALCKHWNIGIDEVICFGDGANDVKMLQEAGLGIAMKNGNERAKAVADKICGHIDEDGIYHMCKELNLI